jgi:hypothetical protein
LFRNIDLIECYRDEINKYWKEVRWWKILFADMLILMDFV